MTIGPDQARLAARLYAVCAVLFGLVPVGIVAFLIAVFGLHSADWKLFVFVVLPGLIFIVLGRFIWRQQSWAMIAALLLAVAFRFVLGSPNPSTGALLIAMPVVFAGLTAVFLMGRGKSA